MLNVTTVNLSNEASAVLPRSYSPGNTCSQRYLGVQTQKLTDEGIKSSRRNQSQARRGPRAISGKESAAQRPSSAPSARTSVFGPWPNRPQAPSTSLPKSARTGGTRLGGLAVDVDNALAEYCRARVGAGAMPHDNIGNASTANPGIRGRPQTARAREKDSEGGDHTDSQQQSIARDADQAYPNLRIRPHTARARATYLNRGLQEHFDASDQDPANSETHARPHTARPHATKFEGVVGEGRERREPGEKRGVWYQEAKGGQEGMGRERSNTAWKSGPHLSNSWLNASVLILFDASHD